MEREAYDLMERQEATHWWFVARRKIVSALIAREVPLTSSSRILEAGCGTGGNLDMLKSHGRLAAFEFDPDARSVAQTKSGLEILPGALPDRVDVGDVQFDMIAMLDVLEHLDEDDASLETLRRMLKLDGSIVITVPAVPWLWSAHDVIHHHKRRYTRQQLTSLLEKTGFQNVRVGYFNSLLFPLAVVDRFLRAWGLRQSDTRGEVSPRFNRMFERIFSLEAPLIDKVRFPIGLSLYAVASH